jgi:hypothetical protein
MENAAGFLYYVLKEMDNNSLICKEIPIQRRMPLDGEG